MTAPDHLTDDAFLGGALHILQPARGFRSGLDAVLLAAAAPVGAMGTPRVLDAGAGAGVVGLSIAARCPNAAVTLVELNPELVRLAEENVRRNHLAGRAVVVMADVAAGGRTLHDPACPKELKPSAFDHLVTNPPFYAAGTGTPPAEPLRAGAHQMPEASLDGWVAFLATAGAPGATLTLIHRADALAHVLKALDSRFGRVRILPVHPRAGEPARRVIVSAIKGSRAPLELRPGLILHDAQNRYVPDVEAVLRHGAALAI